MSILTPEQGREVRAVVADAGCCWLMGAFVLLVTFLLGVALGIVLGRVRGSFEKAPNGEHSANHGKHSQDDIQPEKLLGQTGGGALVPVNGFTEFLRQGGGEGSLYFLDGFSGWFTGSAQQLHELGNRLVDVQAGLGVVAHGASVEQLSAGKQSSTVEVGA